MLKQFKNALAVGLALSSSLFLVNCGKSDSAPAPYVNNIPGYQQGYFPNNPNGVNFVPGSCQAMGGVMFGNGGCRLTTYMQMQRMSLCSFLGSREGSVPLGMIYAGETVDLNLNISSNAEPSAYFLNQYLNTNGPSHIYARQDGMVYVNARIRNECSTFSFSGTKSRCFNAQGGSVECPVIFGN